MGPTGAGRSPTGPGRLVGYPITLLERCRPTCGCGSARSKDALIGVAAAYEADAHPEFGDATGVYVGPAKLAAIDMRVSRQVTSHGFALNCDTDLTRFAAIVPCRGPSMTVCSLSTLAGRPVTVAKALPVAERELAQSPGPRVRPSSTRYPLISPAHDYHLNHRLTTVTAGR